MNAAVIAPAETVAEAHAALDMAIAARWPAEGPALLAVTDAVLRLDEALASCKELGAGEGTAAAAAGHLIHVMTRHCGPGWGDV